MLDGLVRKPVVVREPGDSPWFRLLDTIRHYGSRYLDVCGRGGRVERERHARYYEQVVRDVAAARSPISPAGARRLVAALPDFASCPDHVIRVATTPDRSLRLVSDLQPLWMCQGRLRRGRPVVHPGDLDRRADLRVAAVRAAGRPRMDPARTRSGTRPALTRSIELAELNGDIEVALTATALSRRRTRSSAFR
ncbi:hypothetical protein HBB16_12440 [Pseudonocardia sp. MCCB 268]|nr:hypothetical protein [Pseudonocardia cytotoxica]